MESSERIAIAKDHSGLNKCVNKKDPVYEGISRALKQTMCAPRFLDYTRRSEIEGQRCPD